jgi:pimeloyl-ACP methyl ester carboxylesterase
LYDNGAFIILYKHVLFLFLSCLILSACSIESSALSKKRMTFSSGQLDLFGTLITPTTGSGPYPVVILVHGDGPMPFDAFGYYRPIWKAFAQRGIATFSWDKPGIGGSTGDWLQQSMDDRTENVKNAIEYLKTLDKTVDANNIGVMGFSQAGWVLPKIARQQSDVDFAVFTGTAINWERQGQYYRSVSNNDNTDALYYQKLEDSFLTQSLKNGLSFDEYVKAFKGIASTEASFDEQLLNDKARYGFIAKNWHADAEADLAKIDIPVLAVFGQDDLNVDIADSISVYKKVFAGRSANLLTIKEFEGATHGLMHSWLWNTQHPNFLHVMMIDVFGENMFADNALDEITSWIKQQSKDE